MKIRSYKFLSAYFLMLLCIGSTIPLFSATGKKPPVLLTSEERRWLAENTVRIAPDPVAPPIESFGKKGVYEGISADYIALLEEKLAMRFRVLRFSSWSEVIEKIKTGQADMLSAAVRTPQRDAYLRFTKPYLKLPWVIIAREGTTGPLTLEDFDGKSISAVPGYAIHDYLSKNWGASLEIVPASTVADALKMVSFGQCDATVMQLATASYTIEREAIANLRVAGEAGYVFKCSMAVRKELPLLHSALQKGLANISETEHREILGKWISISHVPFYKNPNFQKGVAAAACLVLFGFISFFLWNKALQKQVRLKTSDLRLSQERYRSLVENQTDIVSRFVPDGRLTFVNESFTCFFGKTRDELIGRKWQPAISEDLPKITEKLDGLSPSNPTAVFENRVYSLTGETRWMQFANRGFFDPLGNLLEIQSVGRDITDRKQAEELLRESESRLSAILDNAKAIIYLKDLEGRFVMVNRFFETYFQIKKEDILGKTDHDIMPKDMADEYKINDSKILAEKKTMQMEEAALLEDGVHTAISIKAPVMDEDGEPLGICGISTDITNRKRDEARLREYSERLEEMVEERTRELEKAQEDLLARERLAVLGHFSGSVAHELRNPLAAIDSAAYLLNRKLGGDEKISRITKRIARNVRKSTTIIQSLLDLSQMKKPVGETHEMADLIRASIKSSRIPDTVTVDTNFPEHEVFVQADFEQIRMAIKNIIVNAVQAMDDGGNLTAALRLNESGRIEIAIADTGPGIAPENLEKVFEPLFTTKVHGIGFGLSITKMIVENHGGTILAESCLNKGSLFTMTFPPAK